MKELLAARDKMTLDIESLHKKAILASEKGSNYADLAAAQDEIHKKLMVQLNDFQRVYHQLDELCEMKSRLIDEASDEKLDEVEA